MKDWKLEIETKQCHIYIVTTAETPQAAWEQVKNDLLEIDLREEVEAASLVDVTNIAGII